MDPPEKHSTYDESDHLSHVAVLLGIDFGKADDSEMKKISACYDSKELGRMFSLGIYGDARLSARAGLIGTKMCFSPGASFPTIFVENKDLEGFYRFVNNPKVDFITTLQPHIEQTTSLVKQSQLPVLLIHDSSQFKCESEKRIEGLGPIRKGDQGFLGHFCLATQFGPGAKVLGVLGAKLWTRKKRRGKRKSARLIQRSKNRESLRWWDLIEKVDRQTGENVKPIHVTDREGDIFWLFSKLQQAKDRFVIRICHDRPLCFEEGDGKLFDVLENAKTVCEREVTISKRAEAIFKTKRKIYPPRKKRKVKLALSAKTVVIERAGHAELSLPAFLQLNVVRAIELDPPPGEEPIEWCLATSEPIGTKADIERIIDIYCVRWTIEEYFKVVKTGCAFRKRQFESAQAIFNTLAFQLPIACKIYNLRKYVDDGITDPKAIFTQVQIKLLRLLVQDGRANFQTLSEALFALAALGGHIVCNGPPGWQILSRGMEKLLTMEVGWQCATQGNM
jgi:hypothetical protein